MFLEQRSRAYRPRRYDARARLNDRRCPIQGYSGQLGLTMKPALIHIDTTLSALYWALNTPQVCPGWAIGAKL